MLILQWFDYIRSYVYYSTVQTTNIFCRTVVYLIQYKASTYIHANKMLGVEI